MFKHIFYSSLIGVLVASIVTQPVALYADGNEKSKAAATAVALHEALLRGNVIAPLAEALRDFGRKYSQRKEEVGLPQAREELKSQLRSITTREIETLKDEREISEEMRATLIQTIQSKLLEDLSEIENVSNFHAYFGEKADRLTDRDYNFISPLTDGEVYKGYYWGESDLYYNSGKKIFWSIVGSLIFLGGIPLLIEGITLLIRAISVSEKDEQWNDSRENSFLDAVKNGPIEKLEAYLNSGIDVNVQNPFTGEHALQLAVERSNVDMVCFLLEKGGDTTLENSDDKKAIDLIQQDKHVEEIFFLLQRDVTEPVDSKRAQKLFYTAIVHEHPLFATFLLKNGVDINGKDENGATALYHAITEENVAMLRFLLSNGASTTIKTPDGFTPLALAEHLHWNAGALLLSTRTKLYEIAKSRLLLLADFSNRPVRDLLGAVASLLNRLREPLPGEFWSSRFAAFEKTVGEALQKTELYDNGGEQLLPGHPEVRDSLRKVPAHYQFRKGAFEDFQGDYPKLLVSNIDLIMTLINQHYGFEEEAKGTHFGALYGTVAVDLINELLNGVMETSIQQQLLELRKGVGIIVATSSGASDADTPAVVDKLVAFWRTPAWQETPEKMLTSRNKALVDAFMNLEAALEKLAYLPHGKTLR